MEEPLAFDDWALKYNLCHMLRARESPTERFISEERSFHMKTKEIPAIYRLLLSSYPPCSHVCFVVLFAPKGLGRLVTGRKEKWRENLSRKGLGEEESNRRVKGNKRTNHSLDPSITQMKTL